MKAVFKREVKSYFTSPVGYVCIAALLALYGFYYFQVMMSGSSSLIASIYSIMFTYGMMIIPIITMKSMSEDRKNKTDQALLTAPVGVTSIVLGKFFASYFVFFVASTLGLLPAFTMMAFSNPPMGIVFGNYIGTLLYGGAMIAIGVFISSLTESQVIAAIGTFIVSIVLMFIDTLAGTINNAVMTAIIELLSFHNRYNLFTQGMFSIAAVVFFISVMAVFVFLTARRLESRRWR